MREKKTKIITQTVPVHLFTSHSAGIRIDQGIKGCFHHVNVLKYVDLLKER